MINWKGHGRKRSWPNFKAGYYPSICLEKLRKTIENITQDNRSSGQDLNPESPEYKAGVLTTRRRLFVAKEWNII
jgi:hypothetical protein